MRKKLILGMALLLVGILCGYFFSRTLNVSTQMQKSYSGFLVCQSCAASGKCMMDNNIDVSKYPEKHPVNCLKMFDCVRSGYGIFVKNNEGTYNYYIINRKISFRTYKSIITHTKKTDNLLVDVTGKLRNNILTVSSIAVKQ